MDFVPLKLILTLAFMGRNVLPKSEIKQVSEVASVKSEPLRAKELWRDHPYANAAFPQWCHGYLTPRKVRKLLKKLLYQVRQHNTGLRKGLKCAGMSSEFPAHFCVGSDNEGCANIPENMRSVLNTTFWCFSFAVFQTKMKTKALITLESRNPERKIKMKIKIKRIKIETTTKAKLKI